MGKKYRNTYIINHAFRRFLVASVLTGILEELRMVSDAVFVSNFVGPEALSALNLVLPVTYVLYAAIIICCMGTSMQAAQALGRKDEEKVNSLFSSSLFFGCTLLAILSGLCVVFLKEITSALGDGASEGILQMMNSYGRIALLYYAFLGMPIMLLRLFISNDGNPMFVTKSIILSFILNAGLDFLFVGVCGMGIVGAAWASVLGDLFVLVILILYALDKKFSVKLIWPEKFFSNIRESLSSGISLGLENIVFSTVFIALNHIVLDVRGDEGVFILSIIIQILVVLSMFGGGIMELNESIGGILLGEGDWSGFKMLINQSYKYILFFSGVCVLLMNLWPEGLVMLFGEDNSAAIDLTPIKLSSVAIVSYMIIALNSNVHTMVGHERLAISMVILQAFALILTPLLFTRLLPDELFWWSIPAGLCLVCILQICLAFREHIILKNVTEVTLIPTIADDISVSFSTEYNDKSVETNLQRISRFVDICEVPSSTANCLNLCCEEIMYNIANHPSNKGKSQFFDVQITERDDNLILTVKDAGRPFNPVMRFEKTAAESYLAGERMYLGLQMINRMCDEISYKYMFGLNVTTMKFTEKR